jgi:CubicO group peptidase (beta-lactamase class C family)
LQASPSALTCARWAPRCIRCRGQTTKRATYIPKLAAAPLDFQPGTRWSYSALAGIDTLGRIVEIVSGMTFDEFLRQRLFEPLGMRDTHFVIPAEKQSRLLPLFRRQGDAWQAAPTPGFLDTRTYFSGAGGLSSTAHDYIRFEQMLVNGGELDAELIGVLMIQQSDELVQNDFATAVVESNVGV